MKKKILKIAYYINYFAFFYAFASIIFVPFLMLQPGLTQGWIISGFVFNLLWLITCMGILILFANNLIVWYKKDREIRNLVLLIFFSWIYSPRYYKDAEKKGWL